MNNDNNTFIKHLFKCSLTCEDICHTNALLFKFRSEKMRKQNFQPFSKAINLHVVWLKLFVDIFTLHRVQLAMFD